MTNKTKTILGGIAVAIAVLAGVLAWTSSPGDDRATEAARGRDDAAASGVAQVASPTAGSASSASGAARPALTVTTAAPREESWPVTVAANGSVAAWQEIVVGSEVSGLQLAEVLVNVGDRVRRGQLLARLSADTVQAERAQIRAALAEAEATLADANANAERAQRLDRSGAISAQQIEQYRTAAQTARARVEAQRARLQAQELRLSNTRIVAPDDGIVSARNATMGAIVQPGAELFRLIRGARLEWRAEVPGAELPRVKPGLRAALTSADGTTIEGRVRVVAPTVDPQTRMGLVYVDLPQPGSARAGMFARGTIALGESPARTIPQSALALRDGFAYVFRVGPGDKVEQRKVSVGRRIGDRVEIVDGLEGPGADVRVVDSGVGFLVDGDLVRIVDRAPS
ncbi:MAG: efflux RND transporter periplasmic adaptor subunit [Burkholderiaceae bacterium]|nr:efflux RND transporter periplasmic adaptor subunit [Burkholderiaceae bacterium]